MVVLLILVFLVFLNRAVAEIRPASSQIAMENRRRGRATAIKDTAQRWRGEGEPHSSKGKPMAENRRHLLRDSSSIMPPGLKCSRLSKGRY